MLKNWICHAKSDSYLFLYTRNLWNESLKPALEYQITFWICVLVLWIHKGYWVVKKLVWNVRIKDFWYTTYCWFFLNTRITQLCVFEAIKNFLFQPNIFCVDCSAFEHAKIKKKRNFKNCTTPHLDKHFFFIFMEFDFTGNFVGKYC